MAALAIGPKTKKMELKDSWDALEDVFLDLG